MSIRRAYQGDFTSVTLLIVARGENKHIRSTERFAVRTDQRITFQCTCQWCWSSLAMFTQHQNTVVSPVFESLILHIP